MTCNLISIKAYRHNRALLDLSLVGYPFHRNQLCWGGDYDLTGGKIQSVLVQSGHGGPHTTDFGRVCCQPNSSRFKNFSPLPNHIKFSCVILSHVYF